MTVQTETAASGVDRSREIRLVFLGLMVVMGLSAIDQSIVATALPRIVADLGGVSHLSWVVTAYVLVSTATMPLYGKLSDQYGRKPMLYAAILTFLLGSVLCGLSQDLFQLIIFRAIQGLGAGGLLPLAQIVIGDLVTPAERGRRQGMIAAVFAVCSVLGPVLGGVITDLLSWHWIFYVNLPVGAVGVAVIARALKHTPPHHARRIDYLGSALLTTATTAFLLVLALGGTTWAWSSPELIGTAVLAFVTTVLFIWHVRRVPEPVLPLDLFRNKLFVIASVVMALTFVGLMGSSVFFPLFFQVVMGVTPSHSGFLTGTLMIGLVCSSMLNGRVLMKYGRYKPAQVAGLTLAVIAFAVLAWAAAMAQSLYVIEPAMIALGFGLGLVMPNMTIAVQNALPLAHRGVGTATLSFFRSLGGLLGVTGSGAILAAQLHGAASDVATSADTRLQTFSKLSPTMQGEIIDLYRHAIAMTFISGVCIVAAALIVLLFLPELPLEGRKA